MFSKNLQQLIKHIDCQETMNLITKIIISEDFLQIKRSREEMKLVKIYTSKTRKNTLDLSFFKHNVSLSS